MRQSLYIFIIFCFIGHLSAQTIPNYVPHCGLLAWYPFSGNAIDSTLHGNNGTVSGATLTTDRFGNASSAYYFNGTSDYIYIPSGGTAVNSLYVPGSVSISAWTKSTDYTILPQEQIFWRGDAVPAHDQYMLYVNGTDMAMRRDVGSGTTTTEDDYSIAGIDANFHHWVATYDSVSGYMSIYLDGSLVSSGSYAGVESYPTSTFYNLIGACTYPSPFEFFMGTIDDVGVWNRVLSPCEVSNLYHAAIICPTGDTVYASTDTSVCAGTGSVTLTAPGGYSSYIWNLGSTSSSYTAGVAGTYYVTMSSASTCTIGVDTFNLTITPVDTSYNHVDTSLCIGSSNITLTAPLGYNNYEWNTGGTSSAISVIPPGTYWVTATIGSCSFYTDTFVVSFIQPDTISQNKDTAVCSAALPISFQGPAGCSAYTWSTGSTATSLSASSAGIYWVTGITSNCTILADTFYLSLNPSPVVALDGNTSICDGTSVTIGSPEPPGALYTWSTGSTDSAITITTGGEYTLAVTINGCSATASEQVNVITAPVLNLPSDTAICNENEFTLSVNSSATHYLWSTGTSGNSVDITTSGSYWVEASNSCGTIKDSIRVSFEPCLAALPSAFSPNNDGSNDVLYVRGSGITMLDFKIFNRFGQVVFETNDQRKGWDGSFNGYQQPVDVYAYILKVMLIDGSSKILQGNITLLR